MLKFVALGFLFTRIYKLTIDLAPSVTAYRDRATAFLLSLMMVAPIAASAYPVIDIPKWPLLCGTIVVAGILYYNLRHVTARFIEHFLTYLFLMAVTVSALLLAEPNEYDDAGAPLVLLAPFILLHVLKKDTSWAWLGFLFLTASIFLLGSTNTAIDFALIIALFAYLFPWGSLQDWGSSLFKLVATIIVGMLVSTLTDTSEELAKTDKDIILWAFLALFIFTAIIRASYTAHRHIMTDTKNIRVFVAAISISLLAFFAGDIHFAYPVILLALLIGVLDIYKREENKTYSEAAKKDYPVRISVVMPCHNGADYIEAAIDSVQSQTEKNWELLIINDGSQDGSQAIIDRYVAGDVRIKSFAYQTAQGAGAARNTGLDNASGRYIAFLDCDDLWKPEKLSIQSQKMGDTGAALSTTHYDVIDDDGQTTGAVTPIDRVFTFGRLLKCNDIGCSAAMIDRSLLGDVRFPDYRKAQDFVLWCTILRQGFLCLCIHQNLGAYRLHSKSRTLNKIETSKNRIALLRKAIGVPAIIVPYYVVFYMVYGIVKQLKSGKGVLSSNKAF